MYGPGNRRPLQYIRKLRQSHGELQSKDQDDADNWQSPQGSSSHEQPQYQHSVSYQAWPQSAGGPQWPEEISPPQPQPPPRPRGFTFGLNLPFGNAQGQREEHSSTTEHSHPHSGGNVELDFSSEVPKPSSIQIHGGKHPHTDSKPGFHLSLTLPIPTPKPSSSDDSSGPEADDENGQQEAEEQIPEPVDTQPTDSDVVSSEQPNKPSFPTEHDILPESGLTHPAPLLPMSYYQQPDTVLSGYYTAHMRPTLYDYWRPQSGPDHVHVSLFPSKYESYPGFGHIQPSNYYGEPQTWHPQFRPTYGDLRIVDPAPFQSPVHPPPSTGFQSPFERHGHNVFSTANYAMGNVVQMQQRDPPPSYPFRHSIGRSGSVVFPRPPFHTERQRVARPVVYSKLLIDA